VEWLLFPPVVLDRDKLAGRLEGKTILITGASSGIGEQLAYLLADCRVHLILAARCEERLHAIRRALESKAAEVSVVAGDLRDPEQMENLLAVLHRLPGGLDIVVSNAGHSIRRSIWDSLDRFHDFSRTMAINYAAPVRLLLSVLPLLERRRGHIVNVSTVNALLPPFPGWAAYQASKGAFDIWLRAEAPELERAGIAVTSVYFPLVRTPMIEPTAAYRKLPARSPQDAAAIIGRMLVARRRSYRPWWMFAAQPAAAVFRPLWNRAVRRLANGKGDGT
jgi:NAD(P)-dependent dehydrogenase (short-subunit alcohol dehydrogenase family)